jgi:cytochrome c peroxidase
LLGSAVYREPFSRSRALPNAAVFGHDGASTAAKGALAVFSGKRGRFAIRVACVVAGAACAMRAGTGAAEEDAVSPFFTDTEIKIILSHGPWPAPAQPDPTNRVSAQPDAIEFGTRLFFDQRLSDNGTMSCASCHVPERNWTDNLRRGVGKSEVDRNTPTLMNLLASRWYGWDGAADSLWSQSLRPILNERELAATPRHVAQLVREDEQLSCRYRKAFGAPPSATDDEAVFVDVGKALAAFEETLVSGRTPFDRFRDTLAQGERPPLGTYSEPAQRGLKIFIGKGGCTACHSGPNFTSGEFFSTGLSRFAPRGQPDPGRDAGIRRLLASRFNLLGPYNDDKTGASAARTRQASLEKAGAGEFKVPSLRNLILTAPYGRDGSVETLAEVVRHYATLDPVCLHAKDGKPANPLNLTRQEQTELVVFLESLSTFSNPWRPDDGGQCR